MTRSSAEPAELVTLTPVPEPSVPRALVPLEIWPSLALRLSPFVWGAIVAAVLIAGALLFRALLDRVASGVPDMGADAGFATRVALVASLSVGYTLGAWRWVSISQYRDFLELGVPPEGNDPKFAYSISLDHLRRSRLAGAVGIAFFLMIVELPAAFAGVPFAVAWTSLHALSYMLFLGVLFFWICGRVAYFTIERAQFRSVLDRLEIDVLDQKPLRVFGRIGLRNALVWVLGVSIGMLAFVNPEIRITEALIVLTPLLIVSTGITLAALLLPVRGLHARIVTVKAAELARIEAAIRGDLSALAGSPIVLRDPPPSLADLIAYRGLVESAPSWPYDGSTLGRLGLYLLIPLGSWIGGALVERAVAAALD